MNIDRCLLFIVAIIAIAPYWKHAQNIFPNSIKDISFNFLPSFDWYTKPNEIHYVNTTQFKESIFKISELVQIDYTPMLRLSTTMTEETGVPREFSQEILYFFDNLSDEMTATDAVADGANEMYHRQKAQLNSIVFSLSTMRRRVSKSNIPGFVNEINDVITWIDKSVSDLKILKSNFRQHKENILFYYETSEKYRSEIDRKQSETKENGRQQTKLGAGLIGFGLTSAIVNPVLGLGVAIIGAWSAVDTKERVATTLKDFENAANMFEQTSNTLDECFKEISLIINNLNSIAASLREIQKQSERVYFKLGTLENTKFEISDDDKNELHHLLDFVISTTIHGEQKYEPRSVTWSSQGQVLKNAKK